MTYATAYREYPGNNILLDRLRDKFKDSGIYASRDIYASAPTQRIDVKAVRKNNANYVVRRANSAYRAREVRRDESTKKYIGLEGRIVEAKNVATVRTPFRSGTYAYAYSRAGNIHDLAVDRRALNEYRSNNHHTLNKDMSRGVTAFSDRRWLVEKAKRSKVPGDAGMMKARKQSSASNKAKAKTRVTDNSKELEKAETRIKHSPFPLGLVATIAVVTILFMAMIFSFAEVYQLKREIALEKITTEDYQETLYGLQNELNDKETSGNIEQIAVEDYGMVKSSQVETKYVSVKGGEKVELSNEAGSDGDYNVFSTVLSALGSRVDNLLDYIK